MVVEKCEGVNEVVMVVDQTLLKHVVLKKKRVDWRLLKTVVSGDQGRHLKVAPVLLSQVKHDECEDV